MPARLGGGTWSGYAGTMRTGVTRYGAGDLLSVPATHRDGRRLSIQFSILLLKDGEGRVEGSAAVLRDVTGDFEKRRALEREVAELRRAKRQAVAAPGDEPDEEEAGQDRTDQRPKSSHIMAKRLHD